MSNFLTTDWLNLRSTPEIPALKGSNIISTMPPDTVVEELPQGSHDKWKHIKTLLGSNPTEGFASSLFLSPTNKTLTDDTPETPPVIPEVHLNLAPGKIIRRNEVSGRAFHLQEPGMIKADLKAITDASLRITNIYDVVNWIDVERSARYAPTSTNTFCNIYAYDLAFGLGFYIPRVWWNEKAFKVIDANGTPEIIYAKTVTELNANALTDWFEDYGSIYKWKRVFDVNTLQQQVNAGTLGFIVAQRTNLNRSGHIVGILPEQGLNKAQHNASGIVTSPLQSQAGGLNKKVFTANNWWTNTAKFRKFGFWVREI